MKSDQEQNQIKANFRQSKVLIIDDNNDQWLLMKRAFQESLPEVTPVRAATPCQAVTLLEEWQTQEWEIPKLILLDLYMPDNKDGWELLKKIKGMPAPFNRIPILMFSSSVNTTDITTAYELGVSSYLTKPVDYKSWLTYFQELRTYWWETVTLPPLYFSI
ncbi:response regulator [Spirosoma linguale]|uniref:Response regulator receiver protein n=1 Tax=Spirosoma linguale (strain ATCC 33905 / DSM 74 / LMG 10896 / Claus 1) TaxID=504472 RepID=D2QDX8_SPILD|nr:response regulator receiver protein [Spirosoma linguale DSM 74]